ncbi:ABC transporter permease [Thermococci archaeon]|nr:MAG: ABC transporter permease [Thermococci archaeon]
MSAIQNIASKELYLTVKTKRFIILLSVYLIFLALSVYFTRFDVTAEGSYGYTVHRTIMGASGVIYETPISSIFINNSMLWMFFGALLGILLGADSINRELQEGTVKVLLGHPVYRDEVINGKFLGNALALLLVILVGFIFTIATALIFGIPMEGLSLVRLFILSIFIFLYTLVFLSLGTMISTLIRSPETSILVSIGLVIFFVIVYPILAGSLANSIVGEPPECHAVTVVRQVEANGQVIESIGPSNDNCAEIYEEWREKVTVWERRINILNPAMHFAQLMIYTFAGEEGYDDYLPLSDSLGYAINNLAILIIELLFPFSIAYVRFLTRDLR